MWSQFCLEDVYTDKGYIWLHGIVLVVISYVSHVSGNENV